MIHSSIIKLQRYRVVSKSALMRLKLVERGACGRSAQVSGSRARVISLAPAISRTFARRFARMDLEYIPTSFISADQAVNYGLDFVHAFNSNPGPAFSLLNSGLDLYSGSI
ncbi:hypothetical protein EVAR_13083_1 [Eumeta japonica]|uniref:Uncharacterized protein n=1 Tax=Eumeta variegata TaxID=151549 RepID=A0A4C1UAY1_EUMVA|nr:hypothetical protein EVAR_13083_1 [Eumeta japonica]